MENTKNILSVFTSTSLCSLALLLCLFFNTQKLQAQDPEFSQFYTSPAYINPAMNGLSDAPRFSFSLRDQLTSFSNAFVTVFAGYDQHFHKYRSSIGANIVADFSGNLYNTYRLSGAYAYLLPLNNKYSLKTGFELSFLQNSLNTNNIYFSDELNDGAVAQGSSPDANFARTNKIGLDASLGILFFSENFFIGVSAKHLNTPNLSLTDYDDPYNKLRIKSTVTMGKTFTFGSGFNPKGKIELVPNILAAYQAGNKQLNAGAWVGHRNIFGGLWLRHTLSNFDALIAMVGYRTGMLRIGYSFDKTISGLATAAGAHEINITIDMGNNPYVKQQRKQLEMGNCPTMFK